MGAPFAMSYRPSAMDLPDYLPLSYLNQLLYCERRFWYMYVQGELAVNAALLEGTLRHEHADQPGTERIEEGRMVRRLAVYSDRLRINGFCDLVEDAGGVLRPVEYKRGKQGRWDNDQVQLCAQALCLEERTGRPVPMGEIFYYRSRHRIEAPLTHELRVVTEAAVARAFTLLEAGVLPPHTRQRVRCGECSLEPICLPRETRQLSEEEVDEGTSRNGNK
jgi:CRISPR-associated exonuclease Cas4